MAIKHPSRVSRAAGFTLIELLVVLVIVGIITAIAILKFTDNPNRALLQQAGYLADVFATAQDEAMLRSRPIAWLPNGQGYRFEELKGQQWQPLHDDLLSARAWQAPVTRILIQYTGSPEKATRLIFGSEPINSAVTITLIGVTGKVQVVRTSNGQFHVVMP
jgi:general secretion pathway protein H